MAIFDKLFSDRKPEARAPGGSAITDERISKAYQTLREYKAGKINLERRIIDSERWWKLRHWDSMTHKGNLHDIQPKSAWLFNVVMGKQADNIEAYPEPMILPREQGDEGEAEVLTDIIPLILEQNGFEATYSSGCWTKNKSGTAVYGVYWDGSKLNGLGDISIRNVDVLNLFWEPGISDIQESKHVFHVEAWDNERLKEVYPHLEEAAKGGGLGGEAGIQLAEYIYDDSVPKDNKTLVIDWYYKKRNGMRDVLHYCKLIGRTVVYASEDDPAMVDGWYIDAKYPFIFDRLFPVEGSICGYGYIDIGKSPQEQIDLLGQALIKNALFGASPRSLASRDTGINEQEYLDYTKSIVHVEGSMDDSNYKPLQTTPLGAQYIEMYQQLIEQMKYTTGNLDVINGGSISGVTAASAIAALQESAGRSSKSAIKASYRAYADMIQMVIERIRQFYNAPRVFRIIGAEGAYEYITYLNSGLRGTPIHDELSGAELGIKKSVFDIKVRAQKQTTYSRLSQNELAVQLFSMGVFNPNPALAEQALMMLEMMDFPGKDEIVKKITERQTLYVQRGFVPQAQAGYFSLPAEGMGAWEGKLGSVYGTQGEAKGVADARARTQASSQPE